MTTPYIDPQNIFASDAPTQDKPPAFNNYVKGMDETRSNDGRPTIKQFNFIQQQNDFKFLYIHEHGACLPFVEGFPYENNAIVFKDGELQKKQGASWVSATNKGYNLDYFVSGKSYPLHAEIMLTNGDIVKSTINGNTNDPDVNMTGWEFSNSPNSIITVNSVAKMLTLRAFDGLTVRTNSYHAPNFGLRNPFKGGASYTYDLSRSSENDGFKCINGWVLIDIDYTPEKAGAYSNGIDLDDDAFIRLFHYENISVRLDNDYIISSNLSPKINTILFGNGSITQNVAIDSSYTWGLFTPSSYPMFKVTADGFGLIGLTITPIYEVVVTTGTRSNMVFRDNIVDGGAARSYASAFVLNETVNTQLHNNIITCIGRKGTYVSTTSYIGTGCGIYAHSGVTMSGNRITYCGHCAIYGIYFHNMNIYSNTLSWNGASGMQFGVNASHHTNVISNNIITFNNADGIDINANSDTTAIASMTTVTGNIITNNGWFDNDLTKATADGGGITQRGISQQTVTGNLLYNNRGVGMYITATDLATITGNLIINTLTTSVGIQLINTASNSVISANNVYTVGNAFATSNAGVYTGVTLSSNNFRSTGAAAALIYAGTYNRVRSIGNKYRGESQMNVFFSSESDEFVFGNTLTRNLGLYVGMSYGRLNNGTVSGAAEVALVHVDGGESNSINGCTIQNTSTTTTSSALKTTSVARLTLFKNYLSGVIAATLNGSISSIDNNFVGNLDSTSTALYFTGVNRITGTATYSTKPFRAQYIQDT